MNHSAHITFVSGSLLHLDVEAPNAQVARELVFAKFPPGTVARVSAWPAIRTSVTVNLGAHRAPVFDSSFGCLV